MISDRKGTAAAARRDVSELGPGAGILVQPVLPPSDQRLDDFIMERREFKHCDTAPLSAELAQFVEIERDKRLSLEYADPVRKAGVLRERNYPPLCEDADARGSDSA